MGSEAQCCRKPIHNLWDETARKFREFEHNLWNRAGNRGGAESDNRTLTRGKARPMSPFFWPPKFGGRTYETGRIGISSRRWKCRKLPRAHVGRNRHFIARRRRPNRCAAHRATGGSPSRRALRKGARLRPERPLDNTRRADEADWRQFAAWPRRQGLDPGPRIRKPSASISPAAVWKELPAASR